MVFSVKKLIDIRIHSSENHFTYTTHKNYIYATHLIWILVICSYFKRELWIRDIHGGGFLTANWFSEKSMETWRHQWKLKWILTSLANVIEVRFLLHIYTLSPFMSKYFTLLNIKNFKTQNTQLTVIRNNRRQEHPLYYL